MATDAALDPATGGACACGHGAGLHYRLAVCGKVSCPCMAYASWRRPSALELVLSGEVAVPGPRTRRGPAARSDGPSGRAGRAD